MTKKHFVVLFFTFCFTLGVTTQPAVAALCVNTMSGMPAHDGIHPHESDDAEPGASYLKCGSSCISQLGRFAMAHSAKPQFKVNLALLSADSYQWFAKRTQLANHRLEEDGDPTLSAPFYILFHSLVC